MNFVPCVAWVSRGKAASTPDKLQLSPEELKRLVDETKELCNDQNKSLEETDEDEDLDETNQEEDEDLNESEQEEDQENVEDECDASDNESDDFDSRYDLDSYDNDDDQNPLFTINDLAVHVDNRDDDYLTDQESEGDLEEKEDFSIKDSDNLLIVGHIEDSSSVLQIHVYNQEDDDLYVHHDIVLPSYPLALAWLDFHPSEEKPGNYVAVGDMSSVIKIWDLDVVDVLEPDYTLGKISKKKKAIKKEGMKCHSDAVISLSWNKQVRNLLASGSADSTVIVWDLEQGAALNQISFHTNKVQALEWHPTESQFLLSGCTDGFLKLYDYRSEGESKSWKVNGEIEKVAWNISNSIQFFCSTDQGYIHSIDMRKDEVEFGFQAHKEAVTGLEISPLKPNILISASMDETLKVWDLENCKMIKSLKLKVGSIYTAKVASDQELTVAVGGNNASNSLKVLNIFKSDKNKESNDGPKDVKFKNEKELPRSTQLNTKNIYESNDEHKDVKIKREKDLPKNTQLNTRKIYESSDEPKDVKIKREKDLPKNTQLNTRKIYGSDDEPKDIKNEKDLPKSTQLKKRKRRDMEPDDKTGDLKIKEQKLQNNTKLNKRIIYSE